ncbi:Acyl-CoA-binding domain-containing protein 1 [Coemansia sp. BCRC 34301]|nr:Acyl-CoA-binding domain-containing protein 1 [Coemansia sp. BCRC 34301]
MSDSSKLSAEELKVLQEDFDKAAKKAPTLPDSVTNVEKLALYGLFKQATVGEITDKTPKPGMFDIAGKAKFKAWTEKKGMDKVKAQKEYIALVETLAKAHAK